MAAYQTLSHPWKPPLHLLLVAAAGTLLFASAPAAAQNNNNNNYYNNPYQMGKFNPSMAIIIVVLVCVFFFLGFFSIYIRQCAGDGRAGNSITARALQAAARSRLQRGLDPAVLETFPTLVYSEVKGLKIGKESLECAVCLSEFEDEEKLRLLPKCNHVFHPDCIDEWLQSHVTCPVCRANLAEPAGDSISLESQVELTEASGTEGAQPLSQPEQMVIPVDHDRESLDAEAAELERIGSQRRQARAAAAGWPPALALPLRFPRSHSTGHSLGFPRSHSTGHSLVQTKDNIDRYTLRLPEHIRRQIVAGSKLQRTKSSPANSFAVGGGGEGSTRRGWRLGRSDRWPSFLVRTLSVSAWGSRRVNGDREESLKKNSSTRGTAGEGSVRGKLFDCLGGGTIVRTEDAIANESPTAPLARV